MSPLGEGLQSYAILLAIALFAHEPWRWLGLILGRNLSADSDVFLWVRAVAAALVAGLVMRLLIFPSGALEAVPAWLRALGILVGVALFAVSRGGLFIGVASGAAVVLAGRWLGF